MNIPETDEYYRYIENVQSKLLPPESDRIFDAGSWARWWAENSPRFRDRTDPEFTPEADPVRALERLHEQFKPKTCFELPQTHAIFMPLLSAVELGANRVGLRPVRNVRLATSTDVSATPLALPSTGDHVLFVGLGTSTFCNYWAKAFTAIIRRVASVRPAQRLESADELIRVIANDSESIRLATRLAVYYTVAGTLLGFGVVHQPRDFLSYRIQLVHSMEIFAVAHEYSHFVAEERAPHIRGMELEFFCDELGLQISRHADTEDWLTFCGAGFLTFFRSVQLTEIVRDQLSGSKVSISTSERDPELTHPPLDERIANLKSRLVETTVEDQREQVAKFVEEYDHYAIGMISMIREALIGVMQKVTET